MTILFFILVGAFTGIMIPALVISILSGITIKILEIFKIFKRGSLTVEINDYITGDGYHRRGKVYFYFDKNGHKVFANGKVFGFLILIFVPLSVILSIIIYFLG